MFERFAWFPERASTIAGDVDLLFHALGAVCAALGLGVLAVLLVLAIRYRRGPGNEVGAAVEGSGLLQVAWALVPAGVAVAAFLWSAAIYVRLHRPPANALEIRLVGRDWMWKAQHLEGRREINEIHVPVGQPIRLRLTSQDVVHSFFVPAFRVKADAVPGRDAEVWFEATRAGAYRFFCAEYCGTGHAGMGGRVIAMEPADYQAWLEGGGGTAVAVAAAPGAAAQGPEQAGAALFEELGCVGCHREGQSLGPVLAGVFGHEVTLQGGQTVVVDEAYIRESILDPGAKIVEGFMPIMPSFQGKISEQQLEQLVAYVRSLGSGNGGGGQAD